MVREKQVTRAGEVAQQGLDIARPFVDAALLKVQDFASMTLEQLQQIDVRQLEDDVRLAAARRWEELKDQAKRAEDAAKLKLLQIQREQAGAN